MEQKAKREAEALRTRQQELVDELKEQKALMLKTGEKSEARAAIGSSRRHAQLTPRAATALLPLRCRCGRLTMGRSSV